MAVASAFIAGCASGPLIGAFPAHEAGLPNAIELAEVPFFPQEDYWCGPSALATLLHHVEVATTPEQVAGEVYLPGRKGSLQMELVAAARARERLVYLLEPDLNGLLREVAARRPVLVLQNLGLSWLPRWHYAVVVGFDLAKAFVILRSGRERRWQTPLSVFDRTWSRSGRWAAVILKPGVLPATAQPDQFVRAAHDLETTGKLQAALRAYASASAAWPDHFALHFALGNVAYRLGELAQAESTLRRATQISPEMAPAWNNLAYVLAAKGCRHEARTAAQCAANLTPEDPNVVDTLRTMTAEGITPNASCESVTCLTASGHSPSSRANSDKIFP